MKRILKTAAILWVCGMIAFSVCIGCAEEAAIGRIKVLIVPKFEIGEMTGDFPGEAQLFYEKYCPQAEEILLPHAPDTAHFYFNPENGVAILVTGSGKTAAALALTALLNDPRWDLTEAWVVSVGCAGGNWEDATPGDVILVTAACDNELGHTADAREFDGADPDVTWFYDSSYDSTAYQALDGDLADRVYEMVRDVPLRTTDATREVLKAAFPDEDWRLRDPMVRKGTALSGDSYWKGIYGHNNALAVTAAFGAADPYAVTEMEELTVANTLACYGMTDRLVSLRVVVDLDVFLPGDSPERLWLGAQGYNDSVEETETFDIFETGMEDLFAVSEKGIDGILEGRIRLGIRD